jgi:hypothetical protein
MSSNRIVKRALSSTERRHRDIQKIILIGIELFEMGRCTPCQNSNAICFVLKGYNKCSSCMRKGVKTCDGNFSEAEFDSLESKKKEFRSKALTQRVEVARLVTEAAKAYAALTEAQQAEIAFEKKAEKYAEAQSRMLLQELKSLDELEAEEEEAGASLSDQVVVSPGADFVWDDAAMSDFLNDIPGQIPV